jgi:alpha-glucoside transport system permease protein
MGVGSKGENTMQQTKKLTGQPSGGTSGGRGSSALVQAILSLLAAAITLLILWQGFLFLRDSTAPKWSIAIIAILWGVGGIAALFYLSNTLIEQLPGRLRDAVLPYLFVGPAMALLIWYLALPAFRTFRFSLLDRTSVNFVGLQNYVAVFTERFMLEAFRNNLLWIVVGATLSVVLGLLVAVLADRSRFENLAKSLVFLPMAISMVGAGVIWNFIYEVRGANDPQIGLLNAIVVGLGGEPQAWTTLLQPWNNLFLIVIVIWLQSGYAMVLFSAAIKGIPSEILEAARVDGATEVQIFFRIMLPFIRPTIITVSTTVVIFTLKIFDVVMVMTGGQFGTEVIATQFYRQYFSNRNFGLGSAIAMVLLIAVIPVMIYNLRQFREREAF